MNRVDWFVRIWWVIFTTLAFLTVILGLLWADDFDNRIYLTVEIAKEYKLNRNQVILMCGIYEHELTPKNQMKTFGYFGIRKSMCEIVQYCKSDEMLFIVCAGLCASTIKHNCQNTKSSTLAKFGKIYATDPWWINKVRKKMKKYENIIY